MRIAGRDVVAGLSVAGLLLPEAVAYAGIAGLPAGRAVAAAIVAPLVYAAVGGSRFAVVSPTSSSAAILAAILATFPIDAAARADLATAAIAIAGAVFVVARIAGLGLLTGFIARPVARGFAFGLAVTIIVKQIPAIVGIDPTSSDLPGLVVELARRASEWRALDVAVGTAALVALMAARRAPSLPGAFLVILIGAGTAAWLDPTGAAVATVGAIDVRLVLPHLVALDWETASRLTQLTLPLVLILFAESWGTMRSLALGHGDAIAPDRELGALGLANLAAALAQGLPVGAGFSAGSANEAAGATSRFAGVVAALGLAAITAFAGPLIAHLPRPALAAVVIAALVHALDPRPMARLWRLDRDQWVAIAAAAGVLLFGVVNGMLLAVVASVAALLRRLATPKLARLGRLPGSHDFVDLARHGEAVAPAGCGIWRPSEPLFFGNAERLFGAIAEAALADPSARVAIVSLEETFDLDSTALEALIEFDARLAAAGRSVRLARARDGVRDLLRLAGATDLAGRASYSVDDAVAAVAGSDDDRGATRSI
ncbi:MAG: STAS domain-containing protein [Hyphomicrobiales bacterium]|nr:STAS domain-containing protein [Hyphomicrobiales bacterium]